MSDLKIYILFVIGLIIFGVWLLPTWKGGDSKANDSSHEEWCLVTELPLSGGSFSHPGPSDNEEYSVIITESGFKVYQRCGKI